jgi:hypothetical protein
LTQCSTLCGRMQLLTRLLCYWCVRARLRAYPLYQAREYCCCRYRILRECAWLRMHAWLYAAAHVYVGCILHVALSAPPPPPQGCTCFVILIAFRRNLAVSIVPREYAIDMRREFDTRRRSLMLQYYTAHVGRSVRARAYTSRQPSASQQHSPRTLLVDGGRNANTCRTLPRHPAAAPMTPPSTSRRVSRESQIARPRRSRVHLRRLARPRRPRSLQVG